MKLDIGEVVIYAGNETEVISYIPSTGKYLLRGIPLPVDPGEVIQSSSIFTKDHKLDN